MTLDGYLKLCTVENIHILLDTKHKFLEIQFLQRVRFISIFAKITWY